MINKATLFWASQFTWGHTWTLRKQISEPTLYPYERRQSYWKREEVWGRMPSQSIGLEVVNTILTHAICLTNRKTAKPNPVYHKIVLLKKIFAIPLNYQGRQV